MGYRVRNDGSRWTIGPVVVSADPEPPVPLAVPAAVVDPDHAGWAGDAGNRDALGGLATLQERGGAYRLVVGKSAWTSSPRTEFARLVQDLDASPIRPSGVEFVRRILAVGAPASFTDSLWFNYGMGVPKTARFTVDLRPGLRLRLRHQFNQFVAPPATGSGSLMNGYVTAGDSVAEVVQVGWGDEAYLSLDSFLAAVPGLTVAPSEPQGQGAGGVIDLSGSGDRFRRLRLVYPQEFIGGQAVESIGPIDRACILGAGDADSMRAATDAYYGSDPAVPSGTGRWFFRGRVVVVPEIPIFVEGRSLYVPLGTTVRQVLGRFFPVPRLPGANFEGVVVRRYRPGADISRIGSLADYGRIFFENDGPLGSVTSPRRASSPPRGSADAFDLPLLAADRIDLR